MKQRNLCMLLVLVLAAFQLAACAQTPVSTEKIEPAKVEAIEGTEFNRVVLSEKAAERLDIQTAPVREEQVMRTRRVGGEVVASPVDSTMMAASDSNVLPPTGDSSAGAADLGQVWVRVSLNESELSHVDRGQPARILPLDDDDDENGDDEEDGLEVEEDEDLDFDDLEDVDLGEGPMALYYKVDGAEHGLTPGQRVLVELSLSGSGMQRQVIPYSAVLYDLNGETWVYTNPEPLVFVRQPVSVDYIEGDLAVLSDGPPAGTQVATVGVAELYGADTGVGK